MTFEDSFKAWLMSSTNTGVPASVRAFSFNLCEFEDNSPGQVLKTREGIAVGFIDGDLDVVWHR
jgi:hypothetical protein